MKIKFLQAFHGDSIWISFTENGINRNILIDGGPSTTYTYTDKNKKTKNGALKLLVDSLKEKGETLDLVILTHIDDDHIDGFLKWFGKDKDAIRHIKEVWFNSGRTIKKYLNDTDSEVGSVKFKETTTLTSVQQGIDFENYIRDNGVWDEKVIAQQDMAEWSNISFKILSPGREKLEKLLKEWHKKRPESVLDTSQKTDYSKTLSQLIEEDSFEEDDDPYNGSSMAFLLQENGKKEEYLFLGDSHPTEILKELGRLKYNEDNKLSVEFMKLSHHGSKRNNPIEIFKVVDTAKYVISTNGASHNHPDKATIARIVASNPRAKIYFNYPELIPKIIMDQDRIDFPDVEYLSSEQL
ncbi:ComEC/Rec2 family competence protein [Sphingobacterium siyangense]|uniref:ComEC/Rec2 family competence protein n=1 Tax=Sphingobacterium siyangense TaxID=459529 RepID=UPI002FDEAF06